MPRISNLAPTGLLVSIGLFAGVMIATSDFAQAQDARLGNFFGGGSATSAENLTIETDFATYVIKKVDLHGTSLTNSDLTALLDSKSNASLAERFAKLSAVEIIVPELSVTTKSEPIQKLIYQNIKLSDVKLGKASSADIQSTQFSILDEKNGTITGSYGALHAQALDLALAAHILTEARKDDAEPLKTLYESFSIDGFKMTGSGKEPLSMTIANMSGRNVKARAFAMRPADFQNATNDNAHATALIKDILMSFEMQDLNINHLDIASETDGKPVTISLAKMSFAQFGNAKVDDINFGSLAISLPGSVTKIGDLDFKGLDFQNLREFSASTPPKEADAETSEQPKAYVPWLANFSVNNVDVTLSDVDGTSQPTKGSFSVDHFQLNSGAPINAMPTQLTAKLDHFKLDLGLLKEEEVKALTDLGYKKLDLSSRLDMAWNADAEELAVKEISLSGVDMGAVKVSALIDNVTKDFFSGDATTMQAAAFGASVKKLEIKIDNAGLFEKATAAQAKAQNKSIDEIKRAYVTTAAVELPALLDNRPAAKVIGAALAKFVANPRSFHLTAVSADGLGAADFALIKDPATLLDALEIKATANE